MSKRFHIQDVEPGMILAFPAVNSAGRVVLRENTVLTEKLIDRLQNWHIFAVDILDDEAMPLLPVSHPLPLPKYVTLFEKPIMPETHKKFYAAYEDSVKEVYTAFEQIRYMKIVPMMKMRELADKSLRELSLVPGAVSLLYMLIGMNDRMIRHSLNVAVIAGALGRWLGFSAKTLQDLMLSALLHDVGKTQLPPELANKKTAALTPDESKTVKNHTIEGYQMLKRTAYHLSFPVLAGVLQHHELQDGTGYPLKLTGNKIHIFARVILVADMYETLTSTENASEARLTPFAAIEIMVRQAFDKLDPAIASVFLNKLSDQFIGNIVRLNDGREAVVVSLGRHITQRPVVFTRDGEYINLDLARNLSIVEVIRVGMD